MKISYVERFLDLYFPRLDYFGFSTLISPIVQPEVIKIQDETFSIHKFIYERRVTLSTQTPDGQGHNGLH